MREKDGERLQRLINSLQCITGFDPVQEKNPAIKTSIE
jgi:hypothetical protein